MPQTMQATEIAVHVLWTLKATGVLSASCIRQPENGMTVRTHSERAIKARAMVLELLASDQEEPEGDFKLWLDEMNVHASRFPRRESAPPIRATLQSPLT